MRLTPREREFCEYLLNGFRNHEIAKKMRIADRTAKQYVNRLAVKFDINHERIPRIQIAVKVHEIRGVLGVKCQACGEM